MTIPVDAPQWVRDKPAWSHPRGGFCSCCGSALDAYEAKFVHRESLRFACLLCADLLAIKRGPAWARYSDG